MPMQPHKHGWTTYQGLGLPSHGALGESQSALAQGRFEPPPWPVGPQSLPRRWAGGGGVEIDGWKSSFCSAKCSIPRTDAGLKGICT